MTVRRMAIIMVTFHLIFVNIFSKFQVVLIAYLILRKPYCVKISLRHPNPATKANISLAKGILTHLTLPWRMVAFIDSLSEVVGCQEAAHQSTPHNAHGGVCLKPNWNAGASCYCDHASLAVYVIA